MVHHPSVFFASDLGPFVLRLAFRIVAKIGKFKYIIVFGPIPLMLGKCVNLSLTVSVCVADPYGLVYSGLVYYAVQQAKPINYIMGFQVFIGIGSFSFVPSFLSTRGPF